MNRLNLNRAPYLIAFVALLLVSCSDTSVAEKDVGVDSADGDTSATDTTIDEGNREDTTPDVIPDIPTTKRPPNILLIIADDMGLDASPVHTPGALKPNMPVLQSLSDTGITFENLWTAPVCTPTRATILTGKYGTNSGVLGVLPPTNGVSTSEVSLQSYLKSNASYKSAVIGKWHLSTNNNGGVNNPAMMGVEHYAGFLSGGHTDYSDWELTENGETSNVKEYSTRYFTDLGIDWIEKQKSEDSESPWFLWLAYTAPHSPFHLPPADLISATNLTGDPTDVTDNPLGYYFLMLEALDTEMGRLLESVDRENTIVIFLGDNGTPRNVIQRPYPRNRAKGTVYQGGVNTPMVVSGAGVSRSGQRESAILNSSDLFATIADIAEAKTDSIHDSLSFKGLLQGEAYTPREYVYTEVDGNVDAWAIRNAQYKLIVFEDGTEEMYDLLADPYEATELIGNGLDADQTQAKTALETFANDIRKVQ